MRGWERLTIYVLHFKLEVMECRVLPKIRAHNMLAKCIFLRMQSHKLSKF